MLPLINKVLNIHYCKLNIKLFFFIYVKPLPKLYSVFDSEQREEFLVFFFFCDILVVNFYFFMELFQECRVFLK